jgi:hypothetical protein
MGVTNWSDFVAAVPGNERLTRLRSAFNTRNIKQAQGE